MKDKNIYDVLIDALIEESAAENAEAQNERYKKIAAETDIVYDKRKMRKYFRMEKRRLSHSSEPMNEKTPSMIVRRSLNAISAVFAVCCLFIFLMPSVRAAAKEGIIHIFDNYLSIDFNNDKNINYTFDDITIKYIPDGYVLTDKMLTDAMSILTFIDSSGEELILTYGSSDGYTSFYDNENTDLEIFYVDSIAVYLIKNNVSDYSSAAWSLDSYTISLYSSLDKKQISQIIKNIEVEG